MVIVAVDDEKPARILLESTLRAVKPDAQIYMFSAPEDLLEYVENHSADIAVLDICMYSDLNGVVLAKRLKELNSNINIIFATAHERFLKEAMSLHASGYIMKPVTEEDVRKELEDLRHPLIEEKNALKYLTLTIPRCILNVQRQRKFLPILYTNTVQAVQSRKLQLFCLRTNLTTKSSRDMCRRLFLL